MQNRIWFLLAAILFVAALLPEAALGCPNCKAGFDETSAHANVGEAYSYTIYMMIALPAALIGLVTVKIVRESKKAREQTGG